MATDIRYGEDARTALGKGAAKAARVVATTLGPTGKNVILERAGTPTVTRDGVTVAKDVALPNRFENMGAKLINAVAQRTSDLAGDGTTTATILAQAIFSAGLRHVEAGCNPVALQRGIQMGTAVAVDYLKTQAVNVQSSADIARVAALAANNDEVLGALLCEAFAAAGKDGVITVEASNSTESKVDVRSGMRWQKGWHSNAFMTDPATMCCEMEDVVILLHQGLISNPKQLVRLLGKVAELKKSILIVTEGLTTPCLAACVMNKMKGLVRACAVGIYGTGARQRELLDDVAAWTAASPIFTEDTGTRLDQLFLQDLGTAKKVRVTDKECVLVDGGGTASSIAARAWTIQVAANRATTAYERERCAERVARLKGSIVTIRAGGATESELRHRRARIEDALHATRSAIAEGIVPGGGVALARCRHAVCFTGHELRGDEEIGARILHDALLAPLGIIAKNSGREAAVIVQDVLRDGQGYNAVTGEMVDMYAAGIMDPLHVVRSALEHAASVAGLMLTTDVATARA